MVFTLGWILLIKLLFNFKLILLYLITITDIINLQLT
jgi:hypothetical protein